MFDRCVLPIAQRLGWRDGLRWTIFPILYLVDSLIRGAAIDWHRYDVINPSEVGRYGLHLGIAAGVLGFALSIVWFSNRLHRVSAGLMPGAVPTGFS